MSRTVPVYFEDSLFSFVYSRVNDTGNILDNLMVRMERYADDLEKQVEARTAAYVKETKKVERVLHLLLPE